MKRVVNQEVRPRGYREYGVEKDPSSSTIVGQVDTQLWMSIRGQKGFSDKALLSTTTDDEDFPSPVNTDAVKKYFV